MTQHDNRAEARLPAWTGGTATLEPQPPEAQGAAAPRPQADAGAAIVRQFNGPVTALLLYMNELKQHSQQFAHAPGNGVYLRQVIENALEQTERVSAMLKQISDLYPNAVPAADLKPPGDDKPAGSRSPDVMFAPEAGRKPLTKREREVLSLISDGYSNKQGALRMNISPRTFESHRAEAMRKLGARNTADLVRKALLHSA
ncbi:MULTISPECIES: helix-turn-helix domain-containing protein [Bradyrhizobium]|jgi:DNA-binding CsgD family transcriptional regulator|uniref:helix-turn-helix domain-containing protein n=1 Tax=Bradyrhizobium TaxID=374 RepID=UPI00048804B4|nr:MULTISPECIES: helix-turn-helix transcriptional regulator [Bradyrhizobium]MCS3453700.1 DNA-binding CsgD family transcriptional regulator [Bradyrhizobium elkanii]MCS3564193.1 DNA-binding CsgD family transcriptional regulator [Bradyrhizobium elkanii]MCW2145975.1 DNA-binding CsgD family transcriptional regulator [Bradyrhizobium elkanii]MCW2354952.1 DNA-binding CsgD family transcriptional regulator [Bradyrhizobium elkanii]MCW2378802.1 DNA-binding CsgD family transcriptional regulator [Bradyrhizo